MTPSKYKAVMTYLEPKDISDLKKYSKKYRVTMAQVIREALSSKFSQGDPFTAGYNAGIEACIANIYEMQAAQLRFPSGTSMAELIELELVKKKMTNETTNGQ
jgi:hypothetical protein